jgi:hypothetical protein
MTPSESDERDKSEPQAFGFPRTKSSLELYMEHYQSYVGKYVKVILDSNYAIIGRLDGILLDLTGQHLKGYSNLWIGEQINNGKLHMGLNETLSTFDIDPSREIIEISEELFKYKRRDLQKTLNENQAMNRLRTRLRKEEESKKKN